jgi:hypothetical protein
MDKFRFIVRKSDQKFVGIILDNDNEISSTGVSLDLYSVLVTDEATARLNFTATGHIPSDEFENLISQAKESKEI